MEKTCPKCNYTRRQIESTPDYECPSCGIIYKKYVPDGARKRPAQAPKAVQQNPKRKKNVGYIGQNLMQGEKILYQANLHWVVFIWPFVFLLVAIRLFAAGAEAATVGSIFVLIAIVTGIVSLINFKTSEFGITNKRVIAKVGFIRRNSIEVLLTKVEGIQVKQGILGRILGFGSITVSGTGGTKDPFHKISEPLEFRRRAQEQIASTQDSK